MIKAAQGNSGRQGAPTAHAEELHLLRAVTAGIAAQLGWHHNVSAGVVLLINNYKNCRAPP